MQQRIYKSKRYIPQETRHKDHNNNNFGRSNTPLITAVLYNYITIQELKA